MRIVILGCGTGVGKTRLSGALLRTMAARGCTALGLKPIESGIVRLEGCETPPDGSDAAALSAASSVQTELPHPLYALRDPVSPHLAARASGIALDIGLVADWVTRAESLMPIHASPHRASFTIIETAGGVFSPLGLGITNYDLAQRVGPATWVLVAADALGVLHEVSATLKAMRASGREPDHLVLSCAREPDASTGTNAGELIALGIATPSAVLRRNDDSGVTELFDRLLSAERNRRAV